MNDVDDLLRPTPKATKRQRATRILSLDIERRPGLAYWFDARTTYISRDKWKTRPSTICFAAQWVGSDDVMFHADWIDGHEGMLRAAWRLYDQADQVLTFNGVKFDNMHLRGEWSALGWTKPKPWCDLDLFRIAKLEFGYESKSLDELCYRLGIPGKSGKYSIAMAEAAVAGDLDAQAEMREYNCGDTGVNVAVYWRLLGGLTGAPIVGGVVGDELACPQCGSGKLKRNGWTPAVVMEYALYRCRNCGANVRSNFSRRISNTRNVR